MNDTRTTPKVHGHIVLKHAEMIDWAWMTLSKAGLVPGWHSLTDDQKDAFDFVIYSVRVGEFEKDKS